MSNFNELNEDWVRRNHRKPPSEFLPLLVLGDHLALHFVRYGALTLAGLGLAGRRLLRAIYAALGGALMLASAWVLLFIAVAGHRQAFG